jgi:hypothetical protein
MTAVYDADTMAPRARAGSTQTSVLAAVEVTPKAPNMTERIWSIYQTGPHTPEEVHAKLEAADERRHLLTSVRARICGLHKGGRLMDSGERGLGESLKSKTVRWVARTDQQFAEWLAAKGEAEDAR